MRIEADEAAKAIAETRHWLDRIVIELGLCPFAGRVRDADRIRFQVSQGRGVEASLQELVAACGELDHDANIATTLLIYPDAFSEFADYLDFLQLAHELLIMEEYEGIYQLASFHPQYQFEGTDTGDPANLTNRSPHAMLHLLREADIGEALEAFDRPEEIPVRNQELCRNLGFAGIQALLDKA